MTHKLFLALLLMIFSGQAFADPSGIWQDTKGNYFSLQRNDEGNVVFIDLSRSLPRAIALRNLNIEEKIEYLSFFGQVSQEQFEAGYFSLPVLVAIEHMSPGDFSDGSIFFSSHSFTGIQILNITSTCPTCSGGIHGFSESMKKVF